MLGYLCSYTSTWDNKHMNNSYCYYYFNKRFSKQLRSKILIGKNNWLFYLPLFSSTEPRIFIHSMVIKGAWLGVNVHIDLFLTYFVVNWAYKSIFTIRFIDSWELVFDLSTRRSLIAYSNVWHYMTARKVNRQKNPERISHIARCSSFTRNAIMRRVDC